MRVSKRPIISIALLFTLLSASPAVAEDSPIKAAFREEASSLVINDAPPAPPTGVLEERKRRRPPSVRKASYRSTGQLTGYQPRHERSVVKQAASRSVLVDAAPIEMQDGPAADVYFDFVGPAESGCDSCDSCDGGGCRQCGPNRHCFWVCLPAIESLQLSGGVQGFKGPGNLGQDSSFGFHESLNLGIPLNLIGCGFGAQFGIRGVQSNLSGTSPRTNDQRNQTFVTGGLFRRVDCGLQYGAVVDFLNDSWDRDIDLAQIRGEISWVHSSRQELGFQIASGLDSAVDTVVNATVEATDTYSIFYRVQTNCGGVAKLYAGVTGNSEGLAGGDLLMPFNDCWGFAADFAYLVPENGAGGAGNLQEAWNIGLSLVWQPGGRMRQTGNYYRPLFNVADNGLFFVDAE